MKYRQSGMPSEELWQTFFNPVDIIRKMHIDYSIRTLVDIGCGYGTFLLPIAKVIGANAIGVDIDENMIEFCRSKAEFNHINNIILINGDVCNIDTFTDLSVYCNQIDYITLFNILHCENPLELLHNVYKLLNKNGKIGVIHWKYEETPRGPSLDIRPTPQSIIEWASEAGFSLLAQIEVSDYHFGLIFEKKTL